NFSSAPFANASASFALRRLIALLFLIQSALLLFDKLLLIPFQPSFQIHRSFFQLIIIQPAAAQRFKECARAHVVSELLVSLMFSAFRKRNEKFFVERRQTALNSAQTQTAFARDGPVRKSEREIITRFG